jgi:hypothetical protein
VESSKRVGFFLGTKWAAKVAQTARRGNLESASVWRASAKTARKSAPLG